MYCISGYCVSVYVLHFCVFCVSQKEDPANRSSRENWPKYEEDRTSDALKFKMRCTTLFISLLQQFHNQCVVQIVKQRWRARRSAGGGRRSPLTSNSAGFLPLCVSPSHSFWRTDDVVCLAAEGRREEAVTAEAANGGQGIIGNGQCQPALSSLSITATSHVSHSIKVDNFQFSSQLGVSTLGVSPSVERFVYSLSYPVGRGGERVHRGPVNSS